MVRRVPGRSKWLWLLAGSWLACQSPETRRYIDADKTAVQVRRGVHYSQNQPISGILFANDSRGDTVFTVPFQLGKEHGMVRFFYPGHRLREERFFVMGRKEGTHRGWYETGKLRFEYHFNDDQFDGSYKEWFSDGKLFRNMNYEKGQESGIQQSWNPNGQLKMNYLIKDERRYGLLGTKNCKNVADSLLVD